MNAAFTLARLHVVIAIITIMAALLLLTLVKAKASVRSAARQIYLRCTG